MLRGNGGGDNFDARGNESGDPTNDSDQAFGNAGSDELFSDDGDSLDSLHGGADTDACTSDKGDTEISCEA